MDDLRMAEAWGVPPWRIEEECPYHWHEKFRALAFADDRRAVVEADKWRKTTK